jgi:outer membrane receptor protein involved in Fe transport
MRNVASPSQLLEGRVAGLTVSTTSGNLGTGERMSIRGASSLSASNEPLYVVDGIPITNSNANVYNFGESMSSLASLNLTDIESIEVLKDS